MKNITVPLLSFLVSTLMYSVVYSQSQGQGPCVINFAYDAAGNRVAKGKSCGSAPVNKMANQEESVLTQNEESSEEIPLKESDDALDVTVLFPNPTSGECFIVLNREVTGATLMLYDIRGSLAFVQRVSGLQFQIDLSDYPAGAYFVTINAGDKRVSRTVIKN